MTRTRGLIAVTVAALVLLSLSAPAFAHEEEQSVEAAVLVRQAIALIVNTPGDRMAIEDKITDALKSKKPAGVDLDLVRQAGAAFDGGNLHRVRALLEVSIGAMPHMSDLGILPVGETRGPVMGAQQDMALHMATGEESGTNVAIDPLSARRRLDAGTWIALSAALAIILGGLALAFAFRPPIPLRSLRASASPGRS